MRAVLDRLTLVARGEIDRLAREAGLTEAEVRTRIGRLRRYDPKPGTGFEAAAAPVREPDLIAEKTGTGWQVSLNRSTLPAVSVAEGRGKGRAEARAILRMIEGRNTTLLAVGQEILTRQAAVLDEGLGALVPMTMADVAAALALHESTVSRVVAGTSVDTPRGTWWLRAFFTRAAQDGGPAAGALRDRLARLVAAEDPATPCRMSPWPRRWPKAERRLPGARWPSTGRCWAWPPPIAAASGTDVASGADRRLSVI
jgi:RNA polymerase sigma-54 factor